VRHFLRRATKFIVAGVVLGVAADQPAPSAAPASADTGGHDRQRAAPVLCALGINEQLTIALIFGFIAKEIVIGALAVIYSLSGDALGSAIGQQLDWVQAYSFMLFTLLYTPAGHHRTCKANQADQLHRAVARLVVGLAWLVSFLFYQGQEHWDIESGSEVDVLSRTASVKACFSPRRLYLLSSSFAATYRKEYHMNKGLSVALLVVGSCDRLGVSASASFSSDVSRAFTGSPPTKPSGCWPAGSPRIVGLFGLFRGASELPSE